MLKCGAIWRMISGHKKSTRENKRNQSGADKMANPILKYVSLVAVAITLSLVTGKQAFAGSANGTWLRPSTGGHIKVFNCGGGLGMKVVKSKTKKKVGKVIMCGAKKTAKNKWKGSLLNLDDGKRYSGFLTLTGPRSLKLQGCVLGGLVCKSDTWRRIR